MLMLMSMNIQKDLSIERSFKVLTLGGPTSIFFGTLAHRHTYRRRDYAVYQDD